VSLTDDTTRKTVNLTSEQQATKNGWLEPHCYLHAPGRKGNRFSLTLKFVAHKFQNMQAHKKKPDLTCSTEIL
jgi:hypothetical protein